MNKYLTYISLLLVFWGCKSYGEAFAQTSTENGEKELALLEEDIELAQSLITEAHIADCVDEFKVLMNNPDSFELTLRPQLYRRGSIYKREKSKDYGGHPRMIVYLGRIRGTNVYGGVIQSALTCNFIITESGAKFYSTE